MIPINHLDTYWTPRNSDQLDEGLILAGMADYRAGLPKRETTLLDNFPPLSGLKEWVLIGSLSWYGMINNWRWVGRKNARNVFGEYLTASDLAKTYIHAKYNGKRSRITTDQYRAVVDQRKNQPLYTQPGEYADMHYFDMKSAYWTIIQVIGWDVDYFPGKWLGVKSSCRDFPFWKDKLARNCIVSSGLSGNSIQWTGEKLVNVRRSNPLTNYALWAAVQDVLHGIADDMVKIAGAVYVHTDGYIIPASNYNAALEIMGEWGVIGSIRKSGDAKVYGAGTYTIGDSATKRRSVRFGKPVNTINAQYSKWLRPKFRHFANKTRLKLA